MEPFQAVQFRPDCSQSNQPPFDEVTQSLVQLAVVEHLVRLQLAYPYPCSVLLCGLHKFSAVYIASDSDQG